VLPWLDPLTAPLFTVLGMPLSGGDLFGFASGIVCVALTVRASIWNFPAGILNSAALGLVFLQTRLFADASLQVLFIVLSVQGWWLWVHGQGGRPDDAVGRTTWQQQVQLLAGVAVAVPILWWGLTQVKGASPAIDAAITAGSVAAQILLNQRRLETWWWWMAIDVVSIPLYWARGLPLIAVLYMAFLLMCVQGYRSWRVLPVASERVA
jgi:nicotinamide mononucleotide transporter